MSAIPWNFVREWADGFGEDGERGDVDRGFADFGGEGLAFDADPVAEVEQFGEGLEGVVADAILVEEALDAPVDVRDVEKLGFAHAAAGDDAACDFDVEAVGELGAEWAGAVGGMPRSAEGVDAFGAKLVELFPADVDEFAFGSSFLVFFHRWGGSVPTNGHRIVRKTSS